MPISLLFLHPTDQIPFFKAGKGDSVRARAILRSLISLDDLGNILSLRFTIPNLMGNGGSINQDGKCDCH